MEKVRVRFAPSPTGPLHIGGVRTALYNYLFAKANGGDFILRIEDTDRERFVPSSESYIQNSFRWLGIQFDEGPTKGGDCGPYRQSERTSYEHYVQELLDKGHAYYAFDTKEELDEMRNRLRTKTNPTPKYDRMSMKNSLTLSNHEVTQLMIGKTPVVVRVKIPDNKVINCHDQIMGDIEVNSDTLDDKVIMKSDGIPTYHLANVVDDHEMGITHVFRGDEWLPSLPLHVLLYDMLEMDRPEFGHLPLLLNPDGKGKLSKRSGKRFNIPVYPIGFIDPEDDVKCLGFRDEGYSVEATINYLALLGWNNGDEKDIYTMDELINTFSIERVNKGGIRFDLDKAKWMNKQHLQKKCGSAIAITAPEGISPYAALVADLVKSRATFESDIWRISGYFFSDPQDFDMVLVNKFWKKETSEHMNSVLLQLVNILPLEFTKENIEVALDEAMTQYGLNHKKIMGPLRVALTNFKNGPSMLETMVLLGKETVVRRIGYALKTIVYVNTQSTQKQ